MRGTFLVRAFTAAAAAALIFVAAAPAFAQESIDFHHIHIDLQNAVETDWALSTAGKNNPYNNNSVAGVQCPDHSTSAPGCSASTNGNTFNLAAFRYDGLLNGRVDSDIANRVGLDNWDFFIHARVWTNIAPYVDGNMPKISEMDYGQKYPGNGWSAASTQNEWEMDAASAYTDLRKGRWWLRLGKQQIVYGQELGFQTLDQVDSLNLTRHSLFNWSGMEFSDARIGEWAARLSYDMGGFFDKYGVERVRATAWVAQWQPSVYLPAGSAYNTTAAYVKVLPGTGVTSALKDPDYGVVLEWHTLGIDWSANFYSHPENWGILTPHNQNVFVPGVGTIVAPLQHNWGTGLPGADFGLPGGGNYDYLLSREFPRENIFGGMASYMIQPVYTFPGSILFNGDIVRVSGTYTPHKDVNYTPVVGPQAGQMLDIARGELNMAVDVDRNLRWSDTYPSLFILLEYNYRSLTSVFGNTYQRGAGHKMTNTILLSLSQPLPLARWSLANVFEPEANNNWSFFDQPGVDYKPTSSQEYNVFWNFATGNSGSAFGPDRYSDELVFRAIYKF